MNRRLWLMSLAFVFIGFHTDVEAKKIYKYQDEQGRWHFRDTLPDANTAPSSPSKQKKDHYVVVHNRGTDAEPIFDVNNGLGAPIEFEFSSDELVNMQASPLLPIRVVVPAHSQVHLTKLRQIQPDKPWAYSYTRRYLIGDTKAKHVTGKPYLPPFSEIKEFIITQAFDGKLSHTQPKSRYAVDIPMPAGSLVYAARSGQVVEIKREKLIPGKNQKRVFLIRVLHNDGTLGIYAHLKPGSEKIKVGDKLRRGQPLAEIGGKKTNAFTPHLHFAVQKNVGMKYESIPFEFLSFDNTAITPKQGLKLRHPP